ncbi:MAG: polymerase sigma factor, sigma-70 family [Dehalococcoidia bacterium]|nr:polymerase sigma factor, sigma-70 family [Dehalococcoidia bacterium]
MKETLLDKSDDFLIDEAQRKPEAFGVLVTRYQDRIHNYLYRMTGSREDAEDVAQETFVKAYLALSTFRRGWPLAPWLFRIATNLCINLLKKRNRVTALPEEMEIMDRGESVEAEVEVRELKRELDEVILTLPEVYRVPILLRHLYQLSYEEMAQAMDVPLGTVKTRLFRARELLRAKLDHTRMMERHGLQGDKSPI